MAPLTANNSHGFVPRFRLPAYTDSSHAIPDQFLPKMAAALLEAAAECVQAPGEEAEKSSGGANGDLMC